MRLRSLKALSAGRPLGLSLLLAALAFGQAEPAAFAKDISPTPAFDLQLFRPAIDTKGYITVNASQVLGLWDFSLGLVGTLAGQPLHLQNDKNGTSFNADYVFSPSLQLALGFKYLEIAATLPVNIIAGSAGPSYTFKNGSVSSPAWSGQGLGDLGLHLKARFLNTSKHPVGLALLASVYAPMPGSSPGSFSGDGVWGVAPTVIVDKDFGRTRRFRMALNVGAHLRVGGPHTFTDKGQTITDSTVDMQAENVCVPKGNDGSCGTQMSRSLGNQLTYGLGASYAVIKERFDLLAEVYGAVAIDGSASAFPAEGLLGAKVYLARNSFFSVGGGGSFIPNQTQGALWRVFVGFVFEPSIGDRDGDGLKDDVDKCPDDPEDFDDFEDNDGCPDPDNDRDGILDEDDKCPNEPETKNGYQDEDGCPDTIELDRDGDGIPDSKDQCPDDPEDKDGFQDDDGCPDPDNDQDGILDIDDQCPNDPEDRDGFEDEDGCPDPDNDKDRILDVNDKCPNEPETYNGFEDQDGCPDKSIVNVTATKIEILQKIYFETDKAIIKPISFPLLDAVTAAMKGNPQIKLIEIQGHADERGDDNHNLRLTEDRAQSVRTYLVEHGVEADRMQAHGYGEKQPLCRTHDEECWSRNRRVEFVILKRSDK